MESKDRQHLTNLPGNASSHYSWLGSEEILLFKLSNGGLDVFITNYGATITGIYAPDRNGVKENVVACFDKFEHYLNPHPYLGCVIGRFANRIGGGKFSIGQMKFELSVNDGHNHLHGGHLGFDKKVWQGQRTFQNLERNSITLQYLSVDGEEGYPGDLNMSVTYVLTSDNELIIKYHATTNQPTIVNPTNHSYFNLTGFKDSTIYEHLLKVYAKKFTEKESSNIPSGTISSVEHSPYDFLEYRSIGSRIQSLVTDKGYDINFVLNNQTPQVSLAAELYEPKSGRLLKVSTNRPGLQVYTANWWDGSIAGSQGKKYLKHGAVALETQNYPDAPNHVNFPNAVLLPGEIFETETSFQFLVR